MRSAASTDGAARAIAFTGLNLDRELLAVVGPVTLHGDYIGGLAANVMPSSQTASHRSPPNRHRHTTELHWTLHIVLVPVVD